MATWFGKPTVGDWHQAMLDAQAAQHAQMLAQQQYNSGIYGLGGQSMPSHTHTITTAHPNPYAQTTTAINPYAQTPTYYQNGITTISTGTGPIYAGGIIPSQPPVWAQPANSYYVELPKEPCEGDEITVYYQNGRWLEKKNFLADAEKSTPRGGFSLHEIEEAERIMEELAA